MSELPQSATPSLDKAVVWIAGGSGSARPEGFCDTAQSHHLEITDLLPGAVEQGLRSSLGGSMEAIRVVVLVGLDRPASPWFPVHDEALLSWLDEVAAALPEACFVVLAAEDGNLYQGLLEVDRLFYLSHQLANVEVVSALLDAALKRGAASSPSRADVHQMELRQRLGQATDPTKALLQAVDEQVESQALSLWRFDARQDALYRMSVDGVGGPHGFLDDEDDDDGACAVTGILGFVARTSRAVACDRVSDDPRYDGQVDPVTSSHHRLLVLPIFSPPTVTERPLGDDVLTAGALMGLLAIERRTRQQPWQDGDLRRLKDLLRQAAPFVLSELQPPVSSEPQGPFRRAALDHHGAACLETVGPVLEIAPFWLRHVHRGLGVALLLAVALLSLVHVDDYASGAAVLRAQQPSQVVSPQAGVVAQVAVAPGQQVRRNQPMVYLNDGATATSLRRVQDQVRNALARRLLDPAGPMTSELADLGSQWRELLGRHEETVIRAPRDGMVQEIRLRSGEAVAAGDIVLTLDREQEELSVLALLPGSYRPSLHPGQDLRLQLNGFHSTYHVLAIEAVGEDVVGPAAARRQLGPDLRDSVVIQGPMVWVEARLKQDRFTYQGSEYRYHDGMAGTVDVRLRRRSLLRAMLPISEEIEAGHG